MNEIAFIIRFCYPDTYPEEGRQWRFAWFRDQVLPRILAQTYQGFDIWLWVNPKHAAEVRAMHPRVQAFTLDTPMMRPETAYPWRAVRGLPRYPIQVRMDSDDFISPDFLARAVAELQEVRNARRPLVHFQPYKFDVRDGRTFWCAPGYGRGKYGPQHISAFCVLRQDPKSARYDWLYSRGHIRLWQLADRVRFVEEGYCWAACHGFNDSTEIYEWDRYIGLLPGYVP